MLMRHLALLRLFISSIALFQTCRASNLQGHRDYIRQLQAVSTQAIPTAAKSLALHFLTEVPSTLQTAVQTEGANRIAAVLSVPASAIEFQAISTDRKTLPFQINSVETNIIVKDSVSTPEKYPTYQTLWSKALTNDANVKKPIEDIAVNTAVSEVVVSPLRTTPTPSPPVTTDELVKTPLDAALSSLEGVFQIRIPSLTQEHLLESPKVILDVTRMLYAACKELGVATDRLYLRDIIEGSLIAQFTLYPAKDAELIKFGEGWDALVKGGSTVLSSVYDFDTKFPSIGVPGVVSATTTTSTAAPNATSAGESSDDSGPSAGVVAGAVLGSLLGVGVIGGGAGYLYKKKQNQGVRPRGQDFGEKSPGADGISPTGLSNVDIQGGRTPTQQQPSRY